MPTPLRSNGRQASGRQASGRSATGPFGAIAAGHPLAAVAGLRMLDHGGNAVDACLAAAFVAWVTMPDMCGLGGDMFVLLRDRHGRSTAITGAGPAPAKGFPSGEDRRAHLSTVPGAPAAIESLRPFLTLDLPTLLAPAIRVAERGFSASAMLARKVATLPNDDFRRELLAGWGVAEVRQGTALRPRALAGTLQALAIGPRVPLDVATSEWRARGGLLTFADIAAYHAPAEKPLHVALGGWHVYGQPPMSQAAATLGALGRAGIDAVLEPEGPFKAHMLIEAYKRAYAGLAGFGHAGDVDGAVRGLLDGAAQRADREAIGHVAEQGPAMARNYGETTQCAAVDAAGCTVSLIHSLYRPFGARVFSPSTGLIANDRGASFSDGANMPAAGRKPRHTLVNLLAEAPDGGLFALGTPGAQAQTQTTLQVLAALIAAPDRLTEAVLAPRWSFIGGKSIAAEADMAESTLNELRRMGHEIGLRPPRDWLMGSVSLAVHRHGLCHAVADDRRSALALAL